MAVVVNNLVIGAIDIGYDWATKLVTFFACY